MQNHSLRSQRGAATLVVTIVLLFAMTLVAAYANRNLVFEQRTSANQVRSTQAFEAAEAGLEWALVMLNQRQRLGAGCLPSGDAKALSFRERSLRYSAADGMHTPVTWDDGGKASALRAACVRAAAGWTCSCPSTGHPSLAEPDGNGAHPAFSVEFTAGPRAGMVRVSATGCTRLGPPCGSGTGKAGDASMQVQALLALVPGLATPPLAPLTVKDSVDVAGMLGLHNPDAGAGGVVLHAGGSAAMPNARITTAPGGSTSAAHVVADATLAAASAAGFFSSFFGLDKSTWRDQPAVARFVCESTCGAALAAAIDGGSHSLIWIDGDLQLEGPLALGSHERPVMLVASGAVRLRGGVALHGVAHGASVAWNDTGTGGAIVRGAVISESSFEGDGSPDLVYDPAVLAALKGNSGSFARVPGSWKDF